MAGFFMSENLARVTCFSLERTQPLIDGQREAVKRRVGTRER
jgi:hypothetical protein